MIEKLKTLPVSLNGIYYSGRPAIDKTDTLDYSKLVRVDKLQIKKCKY